MSDTSKFAGAPDSSISVPGSAPTKGPDSAGAPNPVVISIARDYGAEGHEIGVLLEKHQVSPFTTTSSLCVRL